MEKLTNNAPFSIWRILIVTASLFTLVPIVAMTFWIMDIPVALAHFIFDTYGEKVKNDASYLIPIFGFLFIYGQFHKRSMSEEAINLNRNLPVVASVGLSLINKLALLSLVASSVVIALDSSILEGFWLFLAATIASGAGASLKYALIDANHPSQPLMIITGILVTFLSSWIASNSTLSIFDVEIWSGYLAPTIGIFVGLSMSNETKDVTE